ncbi:hypothetical protein ABVT39_004839 [Epinephelus coioides]
MTIAEEQYKDLMKTCKELTVKTDLLENQSRKCNLRILGLPRGIEGSGATAFTSTLMYELFGEEALWPPPLVNIAHRTGSYNKDGIRCMITRMHSFDVRLTIQRLVGERGGKLTFRLLLIPTPPGMVCHTLLQTLLQPSTPFDCL